MSEEYSAAYWVARLWRVLAGKKQQHFANCQAGNTKHTSRTKWKNLRNVHIVLTSTFYDLIIITCFTLNVIIINK